MEIGQWVGQKIGDRTVVSTQRAMMPLGGDKAYIRAVALVLDDATVTYGCTWSQNGCAFTHDSPAVVAAKHWRGHAPTPDLMRVPFRDWTLEEILGRLQDSESDLKTVMAQRDKAIQRQGNRDLVAELRQELKEANARIREYDKAFKAFGKLLPNVPKQ